MSIIEYQPSRQTWSVRIRNAEGSNEELEANVVISAAGLFNPPIEPKIPGLDSWTGEKWHTARWPDDTSSQSAKRAARGPE